MSAHFWLFCKVIDNFGDAGVAWRLASLLQQEKNACVTLFIDDLQVLAQLNKQINASLNIQIINAIQIVYWQEEIIQAFLTEQHQVDCVIELFACDLPSNIINYLKDHPAEWLNLEYLSAEEWTKSLHLLPSPQANKLNKYFYFLGFDEDSGGLLREKDYCQQYLNFTNNTKQQLEFLQKYQITIPQENEISILLFAYPSPIWLKEIQTLIATKKDIIIWLANPLILEDLKQSALFSAFKEENADNYQCEFLRLHILPFIPQADFDKILWLSDIAIIRGEDSFTRTLFAATPFFWHIYPQEEHAHLAKLNAFWQLVYPDYDKIIKTAHNPISLEINNGIELNSQQRINAWQTLFKHLSTWQKHSKRWSKYLIQQTSATDRLVSFIEKS